ncbi:MAG: LytR C-terminal domain-containing protein [Actinomycetota bacterium]
MSALRTERVRPVRAERAASRRRRRGVLMIVGIPLALVALVALVWGLTAGGILGGKAPDPAEVADQQLTILAYRGESTGIAVLATSRSGARDPVILAVPTNVIATRPGHGSGPLGEALAGGTSVAKTTVANLLGLEIHRAGILEPDSMGAFGDDVAGIAVDLGTRVRVLERQVGPGEVTLSGEEVAAYLDGTNDALEAGLRFQEVLVGLIEGAREKPAALQEAVEDADDGFGAAVAAVDPETIVEELPVNDAGSGIASLDTEDAESLIAELFARPTDEVASVVLLNGNGIPGIGGKLGERIVPEGFRVVVSTNAMSFDFEETQIVVRDVKLLDEGRRLRSLLGLGQVSVGEASTGLADITVLIGKDFTGS